MKYIYAPITLTNSQSQASPSNFQQLIQVPTPQYFNGVRFWSPTDGWLHAWLESIQSNSANIWVKIPSSIPANGTYQMYMIQDSALSMDGVYWGEAPQLSSTYAQYDSGANVFNFYDNFAGTTLPSPWGVSGGTVTVNNGVEIQGGGISLNMGQALGSNYNIVAGAYIDETVTGSSLAVLSFGGNPWQSGAQAIGWLAGSDYDLGNWYYGSAPPPVTTYYTSSVSPTSGFATLELYSPSSSSTTAWINYQQATASYGPAGTYILWNILTGGAEAGSGTVQWARTRAYPPNGVMPSVYFGASQYSGELITVTVP